CVFKPVVPESGPECAIAHQPLKTGLNIFRAVIIEPATRGRAELSQFCMALRYQEWNPRRQGWAYRFGGDFAIRYPCDHDTRIVSRQPVAHYEFPIRMFAGSGNTVRRIGTLPIEARTNAGDDR